MNTNRRTTAEGGRGSVGSMLRRWWWPPVLVAVIVLVVLAAATAPAEKETELGGDSPLFHVKRGELNITVASSGDIRSADPITIKNQVEGRTTILDIVEEGKHVEKGDVLMRLDTSSLKDEELEEEIDVESSKASKVNAEQSLELAKKQGEANIRSAKVDLELAKLDLEKYIGAPPEEQDRIERIIEQIHELTFKQNFGGDASVTGSLSQTAEDAAEDVELNGGETGDAIDTYLDEMQALLDQLGGEYKQTLQEQLNNISIAKAELSRAEDRLEGSETLEEKGYITRNELEADQLEHKRKKSELQLAIGEMRVLQRYTYNRKIAELQNAVDEAEFQVEKARHEAEANVVDAEASLHQWRERLTRDEQHLQEIRDQIEAATVEAPADGMVVYGTSVEDNRRSNQEPLAEGVEVRERQTLFRLPKAGKMVADIKIHESMMEKVEEGLPVRITTDALPGQTFEGKVKKIAVLPDSQSRWLNPDLKVYNVEIVIDSEGTKLRPGMSCNAEIIVEEFDDALYIPIQAVQKVERGTRVYVAGPNGPKPRMVELGMNNNRMVRVKEGLEEGEPVLLAPPMDDPDAEDEEDPEKLARANRNNAGEDDEASGDGSGSNDADGSEGGAGRRGRGEGGPGNLSEEQRKKMRERFQNMSEEQRKKVMERIRQRRQQSGGDGGGNGNAGSRSGG